MDLTRLNTIMVFETTKDGKIASLPSFFNTDTMKWDRLDNDTNYFLKGD